MGDVSGVTSGKSGKNSNRTGDWAHNPAWFWRVGVIFPCESMGEQQMGYHSAEDVRSLVLSCKYALAGLLETEPIEGYASEDEIREAVEHLEAALVDIDRAIVNND